MEFARSLASNVRRASSTYDRFFPNQDTLPSGGFGNLIALPLQKARRSEGNTEFLDESLTAYPDQWAYLNSVRKVSTGDLHRLAAPILAPPADCSADEPDALAVRYDERALDLIPKTITKGVFTGVLTISRASQLDIPTSELPACVTASLKRLGTLPNPLFYEKQRLRFPTYNTPRFIFCGEIQPQRLVLPRGTLAAVEELIRKAGGRIEIQDNRADTVAAGFSFGGKLSEIQQAAVDAILLHDEGVLVAPPGAGKTVMGCALIAAWGVRTLVLAHRKPLLEQWRERCGQFLGVPKKEIHLLGQARNRDAPLAVGMLQTLARSANPAQLLAGYGQMILDECHHLPAASFEAVMKQCPAKFILGLTATPTRKDGLQKILFLQCGPVRHRIEADRGTGLSPRVIIRELSLRVPPGGEQMPIHALWELLAKSESRNRRIAADIVEALAEGRCAAVLSDRKEHLIALESLVRAKLPDSADTVFRIDGSIPHKDRAAILDKLHNPAIDATGRRPFALFATSSLLGEGFDLPVLDTLFLAMPISFKGRVIQYAGRLHRSAEGKSEVRIYDYVEADHRLLAHMHRKRLSALRQMGYEPVHELFG